MKFVLKQYDTELISFDLRSKGRVFFFRMNPLGMTDRQRKQRRKLIDFRFTRDRDYNLPAKLLRELEKFLNDRTHCLEAGH